jgi:hypothetical protein
MTVFRDYFELVEPLVLPIRGKAYTIPPPSAEDVVRWRTVYDKLSAKEPLAEGEGIPDDELRRMFLGDVAEQMRADGVRDEVLSHVMTTAMAEAMGGRALAEVVWNSADPKARAPLPTPSSETDSTPSPSTDEASSTS